MIVTCDACGTSFNFDEKMIKPGGSKVRCSKCQSIFTAYPPETAPQAARAEAVQIDSVAAAGGLEDLDLDEIEKELELDFADTDEIDQADPADFDFKFDEDETPDGAEVAESDALDFSELGLDADDTQEAGTDQEALNFDLNLETDDTDSQEPLAAPTADDDLSFDLDLGDGTGGEESTSSDEGQVAELDLDLDAEGAEDANRSAAATDADDDLGFDLDLNLDAEEEKSPAPAEPAGDDLDGFGDLSLELDEEDSGDGQIEFDETSDMELSVEDSSAAGAETDDELDFSLDLEGDESTADAKGAADDEFDFDLDAGSANAAADSSEDELDLSIDLESAESDAGLEEEASGKPVDFDLDLDFDGDAKADAPPTGSSQLEETDEIDLADLEEMIEDSPDASGMDSDAEELDLDLAMEGGDEAGVSMQETDELDLSGLDDSLEGGGGEVGEDDLSDLLQIEPDADDADLDFELDEGGEVEESRGRTSDVADEDEEFNLSDLDDMLEIDGEETGDGNAAQDFDLELDLEEDLGTGSGDDEFEVAEPAPIAETAALDEAVVEGGEVGQGFDMGMLDDNEQADPFLEDEESQPPRAARKGSRGIGGFFKFLLVLVLLGGGGYAAYFLTQYFGVEIPYMDTVKNSVRKVPYVGEWLGPAVQDSGNLNFAIPENEVNGYFVQNQNLGQLYVIEGEVRNLYDDPRRFVRITGRLYAGGREMKHEKTVFAGNVLTDKELAGLDGATIDKMLGNRFGRSKANVNIDKGATIPFMLVFYDLAPNLEEYTVEVADSVAVKK
ncbi:MAG TPA: DUF3426 domain-containing protein [Desulfobacterales bacterium]